MGGVLIIISIVVPTLLWADLRNPYVWIALFALLGFGAIGFYDDYTKVRKEAEPRTDRAAEIPGCRCWPRLVVGVMLLALHARGAYDTAMNVPFLKQFGPTC